MLPFKGFKSRLQGPSLEGTERERFNRSNNEKQRACCVFFQSRLGVRIQKKPVILPAACIFYI